MAGVLCTLVAGCSSSESPGSVDAGGTPIGSGARPIDAGPQPLEGGGSIRSLAFSTNDLVFDPTRGVLYATMNPTGDAGNSVLTIDPASATVTGALPVGGVPSVLAISDDGSALYVGVGTVPEEATGQMDWADSVGRVDLTSMTVGPLVSLGNNTAFGPTAGQIAAVPGSSTQYMVSRRNPGVTPDFAGLALYDGAKLLAEYKGYSAGRSMTFTDPSTLFGYDNESSLEDLVRFSVAPTAITPGQDVQGLITGAGGIQITSNGGWIFATNGQVVSASNITALGTYDASVSALAGGATPRTFPSVAVLPDSDGANVWFLQPVSESLLDFDRTTFLLRRSISLAPVRSVWADFDFPNASALVQWSATGLAFRTISAVYVLTVPN